MIRPSVCFRAYYASIVHSNFQEFSTFQKFAIYFYFIIIEPRTTILGNKELFIEAGSTINLTCIIQAGAMRDTHIFWNYDGKVSVSRFDFVVTVSMIKPYSYSVNSALFERKFDIDRIVPFRRFQRVRTQKICEIL